MGWLTGRRKTDAEAAKALAEARAIEAQAEGGLQSFIEGRFRLLVDGYEKRIGDLNTHINCQDARIAELEAEVKALRKELDRRPRPAQGFGL